MTAPDQEEIRLAPALHGGDDADVPTTTQWEIRSWYMYYVGVSGLALLNFAQTAFQNLLAQASDGSLLYFAGRERDVNGIVLVCNGISFAIQGALFLVIGAYADFGTGRRWVLLVWSVIAFGVGFAWLSVHDAGQWRAAVGLYIVGLIAYQMTATYATAAFPSLARHTPLLKDARAELARGEITQREFDQRDEMERSRLSNVSFWLQSLVEIVVVAIIVGIMFGLKVNDSTENNNWGLSVLIAFATAVQLVGSIPWFFMEQTRPGLKIPPGKNIFTAGLWQLQEALTRIWHLKQSLIYLVGYFFLGDSFQTTDTIIQTLQNEIVSYNTLTLNYLFLVGLTTQALGIGGFWLIQKKYDLSAKTMFNAIMLFIILLDVWGMVGNWTDKFGFHNAWEVWLFQAYYGLLVCPWWSYSQIMISCVTPRGHEFLFFSVFNIVGKSSSLIGPLISSAIIDASPGGTNNSAPFYFLFALSLVSAIGIWWFLDLEESAREQEAFLRKEDERLNGGDVDSTDAGSTKLSAP